MRQFFIIAHNPNSVKSAVRFLKKGANALQPDVCYHPDKDDFFMYDKDKFWERWNPFIKKPRLADYLSKFSAVLTAEPYNLALLAFDLKGPYTKDDSEVFAYDINRLYQIIRDNFSLAHPDVAILTTVASEDGFRFLVNIKGNQRPNEIIGVDQHIRCTEVHDFFKYSGLSYTYATGTSAPLPADSKTFIDDITYAIKLRNFGQSFKLVYIWTLTLKQTMETYLDMDVDGMLVNKNRVNELLQLLSTKYSGKYQLAKRGWKPFATR
ncbi:MAG: hypothetical protein V4615_17210 [Bacteroidota bacterium]